MHQQRKMYNEPQLITAKISLVDKTQKDLGFSEGTKTFISFHRSTDCITTLKKGNP